MPLYADHFAGHMPTGDPRSVVFVAAGCTWPTCPPWRWRAMSDNATGRFTQLNGDGILLELVGGTFEHDDTTWAWLTPTGDIVDLTARKEKGGTEPLGYRWTVAIEIEATSERAIAVIDNPEQKCNQNIEVGSIDTGDPEYGATGDTFRLEQVEFDQVNPP